MIEHEHVAMTLVFGPHDSLATVPTTRGAGPTGRVPEGLLAADEDVHGAVAEEFRSITGIAAGERGPRGPGSFDAWSYAHLGLWSFSSPLWHEPGRMGELARGRDDAGPDADDGGEGGGEEARTPSGSGPDAWLAWIDAERDGEGFAEWTAFDHPQLGRVEIGGLHPDLALQPPADLVPGIAAKATEFTRALLGMMPRLEIAGVHHRPMGGDLHEIAVTVRNAGEMPTRPAIAARARRLTPTLVRLDVDAERLIAGPRLARIERLEAGASESIRWTVRLDEPESVRVIVTDPVHGRLSASLGDREED
jgi:hypothetical protein